MLPVGCHSDAALTARIWRLAGNRRSAGSVLARHHEANCCIIAAPLREEARMIENPPVLTIHRGHRRPDRVLIEAFRSAQTSHLSDAMEGRGAVDWRIKPLDPANANFVGPALTAHAYPADFFAVAGAAMEAEAGDVIMCANEHH